jgi:POT family proton-dependent oligopeptide transporter
VNGGGDGVPLAGTYLVGSVDSARQRVSLLNAEDLSPTASRGKFAARPAEVSTYALVGPAYFLFFAKLMGAAAVLFVGFASLYRERTYVRA